MLEFDITIQSVEIAICKYKSKGDVTMFELGKAVFKNRKGQDMVEYGLLLALISVASLVVLVNFGPQLVSIFTTCLNAL